MLRAVLNKSWRQHPTRLQLYGLLPPITKTIQVRRTRHAGHCWRSKDELISDVLLWTPRHGCAKVGRPARTYIQQLCEDTGCNPEDLPEAMNDREKWRETVRDIRAGGATWWWWCSSRKWKDQWLLIPFWKVVIGDTLKSFTYTPSSSSCHAASTNLPYHLSPLASIIHRSREVFKTISCIGTELLYVGSSWSYYLCSSMWMGPQEYLTMPLLLQQCNECLVRLTWIVFVMGGRWPYNCSFVECCRQDLFNIARSILV